MTTAPTDVFNEHRGLLIGVAYRILGEVTEAEDIVQEAWLRWSGAGDDIRDPKAFLVKVTTRLAIDRLRSAQARREKYVGPWLPEPMLTTPDTASDGALMGESVSMAMLVVLESLSPLERAVFVLREVFAYSHAEIGEVLGKSETAIRQLARRARTHVTERRTRYEADQHMRRDVTERFMAATTNGDLKGLLELLAPEVELVTDGGGLVRAARKVISGPDKSGRALVAWYEPENRRRALADYGVSPDAELKINYVQINDAPAVLFTADGSVLGIFQVEVAEDGRIHRVYAQVNPEKLKHLQ